MNTLFEIGAAVQRKTPAAHQLINQTSGDVEYYTPLHIIEAARQTMGAIDLDPASSATANRTVKAAHFFTANDNGLSQRWLGRVWLNHPFTKWGNPLWINKLVSEYIAGNITQACCICFASTSERWFQPLFSYAQCYIAPRLNYISDGKVKKGVSKGSVVTYLGSDVDRFVAAFGRHGKIMVPYMRAK